MTQQLPVSRVSKRGSGAVERIAEKKKIRGVETLVYTFPAHSAGLRPNAPKAVRPQGHRRKKVKF